VPCGGGTGSAVEITLQPLGKAIEKPHQSELKVLLSADGCGEDTGSRMGCVGVGPGLEVGSTTTDGR
jgi:hypothetical protein